MNKTKFLIENNSVHLWRASLIDLIPHEEKYLKLLNEDELQRAHRFHFQQHRQRFAIARGILREILSLYTDIKPKDIIFHYGPRGKPYLSHHSKLQFNVSHSEDAAVYALTINAEIGVDIQKIENKFQDGVAKRFFSDSEYEALQKLPDQDRPTAFYRIWAGKEALIKAVGEGLYVSLGDFSVSLNEKSQWILISHEQHSDRYYLENFDAYTDYCSAFATAQKIEKICYWEWVVAGVQTWKV